MADHGVVSCPRVNAGDSRLSNPGDYATLIPTNPRGPEVRVEVKEFVNSN